MKRQKLVRTAPASPSSRSVDDSSSPRAIEAAPVAAPEAAQLTSWQREIAAARKSILDYVFRVAQAVSLNGAIDQVIKRAGAAALPASLQQLVGVANARRGQRRALSARSIYRWMRQERKRGFAGLAPVLTPQPRRARRPRALIARSCIALAATLAERGRAMQRQYLPRTGHAGIAAALALSGQRHAANR